VEEAVEAHGGCAALQKACAQHSKQSRRQWQPFAHQAFSPYRTTLLLLGRILPLKAARDSANVLLKAVHNVALEPSTCDYYDIIDLDRGFIPPEWRALVGDGGADKPRLFNRRHLEVVAILELTEAIIHHVHAWSLTGESPMVTVHAEISDHADREQVLTAILSRLCEGLGVEHATVQMVHGPCAAPGKPDHCHDSLAQLNTATKGIATDSVSDQW
jgi:hypothetical protein